MVSTGIQLSYSCITATSNTYTFNTVVSMNAASFRCPGIHGSLLLDDAVRIDFPCLGQPQLSLPSRVYPFCPSRAQNVSHLFLGGRIGAAPGRQAREKRFIP